MARSTRIEVDCMARVEGEASFIVSLRDHKVRSVRLKVSDPAPHFEGLIRGRHFSEVPDIASRICGICPVAHQLTSVHAIEAGLGIEVDPMITLLRRLLYCGEWLASHALSVYMLQAPDFFGVDDVNEIAASRREFVDQALPLKKVGNKIISVLGGEIHPVSVAIGGFHKVPSKIELTALVEELKWGLDTAASKVQFVASFEVPDFDLDYEFVALSHPRDYAINEGRLVSSNNLNIDMASYEDYFVEEQVPHSNALHSIVRGRGSYLVGPLARFNLNYGQLTPVARQAAADAGLRPPCRNPFRSAAVRAVEMVFAIEESLRLVQQYEPPAEPRVEFCASAATGCSITEAPRGINYNRFSFDENGIVTSARIVSPTSQNLKRIEVDLAAYLPGIAELPDDEIRVRCERLVRAYDPCISCATQFLDLKVDRA